LPEPDDSCCWVATSDAGGGVINGSAPLFEQFVAGNTQILRGWNKYELSPLGSTRQIYGSVEYRYGHFLVFYDTGAVWNRDDPKVLRHSVGAGVGARGFIISGDAGFAASTWSNSSS